MAQAIVTKYLAATNNKPARIQVKSWLGNRYYIYDCSAEAPHTAAFNQWLKDHNEWSEKYRKGEMSYRLVSEEPASMPDDSGYCFIIK